MSNTEQFDDFFKKELQNFSPEVPAGAWDKLLQAKEKKRPAIAWWRSGKYLLLLAAIVGTSLLLTLVFTNSNTKVNTKKAAGINAATANNLPIESTERNQTASNGISIDKKSTESNHAESNKIANDTKANENNSPNSSSIIIEKKADENNPIATNNTNNLHQHVETSVATKTNKNKPIIHNGSTATAQHLASNTKLLKGSPSSLKGDNIKEVIAKSSEKNSYQRANGSSKNKLSNALGGNIKYVAPVNHLSNDLSKSTFQNKKNKKGVELIDQQNKNDNTSINIINEDENWLSNKVNGAVDKITYIDLNERARIILDKNAIKSPDCPANEKNAVGKKRYFTFYAGPDLVSKKYIDTSNSTLLNKRKESTSIISAFSAGVNYTNVFANGVSFSAGLNYSQVNEKFNFIQGNVVQNTYVIDPNTGDTTSRSTVVGTRYKTTINRYRTIDIPLTIGYEMGNTNLHVNAYAGAVVNVYSWQKGDVLGVDLQPTSITTGKASDMYRYKTNIGVGLIGGASIFYKLNDRLHLMAQPYCRYNFAPLNNTTLSLQEKFFTIGVKLGIRIDL